MEPPEERTALIMHSSNGALDIEVDGARARRPSYGSTVASKALGMMSVILLSVGAVVVGRSLLEGSDENRRAISLGMSVNPAGWHNPVGVARRVSGHVVRRPSRAAPSQAANSTSNATLGSAWIDETDGEVQQNCPPADANPKFDDPQVEPFKRNIFVLGDSTDKLWVFSVCNAALKPEEQCPVHKSNPNPLQIPANVRLWICGEKSSRCAVDKPCCSGDQCCFEEEETKAAPGCQLTWGHVGMTHVLTTDNKRYHIDGLPTDSVPRAEKALRTFFSWANTPDLPLVVVINVNYWRVVTETAFFFDMNVEYNWSSLQPDSDEFNHVSIPSLKETHAQKLMELTEKVRDVMDDLGKERTCVVFRTQHTPNNGRCLPPGLVRTLNDVTREVGDKIWVPVFDWGGLMDEMVDKDTGVNPGLLSACHQNYNTGVHMANEFMLWMRNKLPANCNHYVEYH